LLRKVRVYADRGIYLSVVGFGEERYDDAFLERIANQGNGQYGYVSSIDDAVRLFSDNLPSALSVLARDAKIQVDFDPTVVRQYRLLGYENRDVKDEDFRNDKIDAGEVGPGSTVTAIYEVVRRPASAGDLGRVHLRYHDTSLGRVEEIDFPIPPGVVATRLEGTSERFRLLASVAELAELLRGSYFARDGALSAVLGTLATLSPATVARPEVREVIDMTLRAREITLARWATEPGVRE
jgi:Ca-activated chloride channel family protein